MIASLIGIFTTVITALSPRYLQETKPRHMAMWSTLRTNKQTHKPNYVNQTGTIKHLFAFDKPRSNIWVNRTFRSLNNYYRAA